MLKNNFLTKNTDWVWNARWESFWIHDKEFLEYTRDDYFEKAKKLSQSGINAVITFGAFHFRWNFIDEWPRLLEMLRWTCEACHKYGIKVVEHHSANLVSAPIGEEEWALVRYRCANFFAIRLEEIKKNKDKNNRSLDLEKHPKLFEKLRNGDCIYKGVRLSSMFQIDPRSGQYSRPPYPGWVLCHNNPDYQRLYFEHLEEIYQCGVDGIMTDDIGFYPQGYGCGCIYCREKFMRDCGSKIPPSGLDDKSFYGNFENPIYREWILWRLSCDREHEIRVRNHFENLGLDLARPIYHSSSTNSYGTWGFGFSLDNLDGLYSTIFTEVTNSASQAYSFLRIAAEASHRTALAVRNAVPPMCLFYPKSRNESFFCWAVTKLWGQNYWGTSHEENPEHEEMMKILCNFEKLHPEIFEKPESFAEIGIVFSARTVILHKDNDSEPRGGMSDPASTDCWAGWCEILSLAGITYDTLVEKDIDENRIPSRIKLLIVPNIVCMSDKSVENIKRYVKDGGQLIITHQSGMKDESGISRTPYPFTDLIGAESAGHTAFVSGWREANTLSNKADSNSVKHDSFISVFKLLKAEVSYMSYENDSGNSCPALFHNKFGHGNVTVFASKPGRLVCINRHRAFEEAGKRYTQIDFSMNQNIVDLMLNVVNQMHSERSLKFINMPYGLLCGVYRTDSNIVVHLLNACGILDDSGKILPMPPSVNFPDLKTRYSVPLEIHVKGSFGNADILRPVEDSQEPLTLSKRLSDGWTVVEIPIKLLRNYAIIRLSLS